MNEEQKFKYLQTRNSNRGALENTFGVTHLHCGSNDNPPAGQFLDALKTVIINGVAYRSKDDGACLLGKLHSLHEPSSASSTNRGTETTDSVADVFAIGKEAQLGVSAAVRACDTKLFLVSYVSGFMTKRLLHDSKCDTCKKCLMSEVPSPLDIYTGFMEHNSRYSWYCCDCFEESDVKRGTESVELYVKDAVKKGVDFDWIRSAGRSLHCQGIARVVTKISVPWRCKRKYQSVNEASRRKAIKRKFKIYRTSRSALQ